MPIYQHSYAWTTGEVEDFWNDLKKAIDAAEPDKQPIVAASSLHLTNAAATNPDWTRTEIEARQVELADLCVATWPRSP